jgi:hypothetical protein
VTFYKIKNAKPEVTDRFQDGHVGNSSACAAAILEIQVHAEFKNGQLPPDFDENWQLHRHRLKKHAEFKNHRSGSVVNFQDGRRRHVENSSECYKMGNYHPILMKIGTQTKKDMLECKIHKSGV